MMMVEELLECDICHACVEHGVDEELIGALAEGGAVGIHCETCQRDTPWRYSSGPAKCFATDPLLETFRHSEATSPIFVQPDPLLVGYDAFKDGAPKVQIECDWFD